MKYSPKEIEEKAKENFKQGYNCAQSVFCIFCEDYGIDIKTGLKLSSSFGGGMGKLREVCGAVSAMFMIAGLEKGYCEIDDELKTAHYKRIQDLAQKFKEENKTIICRELLGIESDGYTPQKRTDEYYQTRPCCNLIGDAARIIAEFLNEIND